MKTTLIILSQPILVSDEEIKEGELFYSFFDNVHRTLRFDKMVIPFPNDRKIIAGLPDLPKLDLSLIAKGIGWVDVYKLAYKYIQDEWSKDDDTLQFGIKVGFRQGFETAQSLNEKKWTDDDMIDFQNFISSYPNRELKRGLTLPYYLEKFKQSRKPKEYLVEVEMEVNQCDGCISGHHIIDGIHKAPYPSGSMVCKKHLYDRPKITNNSIKVTKVL